MLTLTPVALVKASISLTKASSSDCTKYFQRSMDSFASFSGFQGALCAQALAQSSSAGPASAPAAASAVPPFTKVRRVNVVMGLPPFCSAVQSFATLGIEQMHETRIGFEPDLVARLELVALAKHRDHVLAPQFRHHLAFPAGPPAPPGGRP